MVETYDPRLGRVEYHTISGAVAYDDPMTGRMLLLVINQVIHILHLDHHLLCPMQCRMNDVTVNDTPKFLASSDPTDQMHALTLSDPNCPSQMVTLPLRLWGVILLLNVRIPTVDQFDDQDNYPQLYLTSETLTWDPLTDHNEQQEDVMTDLTGNFLTHDLVREQRHSTSLIHLLDINDNNNFHDILSSHIVISSIDTGINLTGNV